MEAELSLLADLPAETTDGHQRVVCRPTSKPLEDTRPKPSPAGLKVSGLYRTEFLYLHACSMSPVKTTTTLPTPSPIEGPRLAGRW